MKDTMSNLSKVILFFLLVSITNLWGQDIYKNSQSLYNDAFDLYEKQQYNAAIQLFEQLSKDLEGTHSQLKVNAELYEAVCAYELLHKDAPHKLRVFMENHANHTNANIVQFYLSKDAFAKRKYSKALAYMREVDPKGLSQDQKIEMTYQKAYCLFRLHKEKKAKVHFKSLMKGKSKYASVSHYYYAHIAYNQGDDDVATKEFTKLLKTKKFGKIAPYYLLQLDFKKGEYGKVIASGEKLFENATRKRKPEIARVLAESYYRRKDYEKAIPYFEEYKKLGKGKMTREESFELGFSYFKTNKLKKSVRFFEDASKGKDTLAQYAYYHLANSYLNAGEKQFAKNAYKKAYEIGLDQTITENSLFNHAQLAFELSSDPYSEAIKALKAYLKEFPNSAKHDEAYQFLYKIALSTKNYDFALEAINNIKNKSNKLLKQYQKVQYYKAMEYVEERNYPKAKETLTEALKNNYSPKTTALCNFWMGEIFFREGDFWAAKKYYNLFLNEKVAKQTEFYDKALYGLGYVHFQRKKYWDALDNFKKYVSISNAKDQTISDALLRMGDSYFMLKRYNDALKYYRSATDNGAIDKDYATYQEAMIYGALRNNEDKIKTLQTLIKKFNRSIYVPKSIYALGNTYLAAGNYDKAMKYYKEIVKKFPNNTLTVKARLKTGLIYTNTGQENMALKTFKGVVSDYPGGKPSKEALESIENIYTELNQVDEFFKYVKGLSFANVSQSKQDSLTYTAAENIYFNGNCEEAISSFGKYITNFPSGRNIVKASYYKADCLIKMGKNDQALEDLKRVISYPKNQQTEKALKKATTILMQKEEYAEAKVMYIKLLSMAETKENKLLAQYGKLKCEYLLKEYDNLLKTFDAFITMDNIEENEKVQAYLMKAKTELILDVKDLAYRDFEKVIELTDREEAAEAQYNLAFLKFLSKDEDTAEKFIFELINKYSNYDYWVAKSFILLADVYLKKDNQYQAEQTLESIIANYEGDDNLLNTAKEKLRQLKGDKSEIENQEEIDETGEEVILEEEF